ncbi:MAG: hypothetical protein COZ56_07805 [Armatimonadetes bacterium CG_4_8_14_3_um_filter_58_9]|nr:MAG: hypothetical protein COZ56_07805 [Armatimonadetes bacterium CG_4_8_14_3_um_filter_58_9]
MQAVKGVTQIAVTKKTEKRLGILVGGGQRREKVPRYLLIRLGLIRFERHKVKHKEIFGWAEK